MPEFEHQSVLPEEVIQYLDIKPAGIYVDATIGGAGHALRIAAKLNESGFLIGIDQDQEAITVAKERLQQVKPKVELIHRNFVNLAAILKELKIVEVDGILFDLGVSSPQLDEEERGFSYKYDAPLDMRMDQSQPFSAAHLVNTASVAELTKILWEYGEERWSKRIAQFIDKDRRDKRIETTGELAEIIKKAIPAGARRNGPHPARRTFQALRIAVNRELEVLQGVLDQSLAILKPGGRIVVISFHSLEDRIVKTTFNKWAKGCQCPKEVLICRCGQLPKVQVVTKKPVLPSKEEMLKNPRARSSKLRTAEKLV
ncbi:MAG TPA: 16S rRNA (cytosine(1402)-N(4))-methyltransferase [Firmicutes bacterium]|nr:16S rRNA (cytosine(1402)-N(4))-methyltransferase [Bacillota bacterium]